MEEIYQLQRRLNEQVLERADADPQWRRQVLDDPQTAEGDIPEARQFGELLGGVTRTEQVLEATMPPTAGRSTGSFSEPNGEDAR
jgi:hypothetical protein